MIICIYAYLYEFFFLSMNILSEIRILRAVRIFTVTLLILLFLMHAMGSTLPGPSTSSDPPESTALIEETSKNPEKEEKTDKLAENNENTQQNMFSVIKDIRLSFRNLSIIRKNKYLSIKDSLDNGKAALSGTFADSSDYVKVINRCISRFLKIHSFCLKMRSTLYKNCKDQELPLNMLLILNTFTGKCKEILISIGIERNQISLAHNQLTNAQVRKSYKKIIALCMSADYKCTQNIKILTEIVLDLIDKHLKRINIYRDSLERKAKEEKTADSPSGSSNSSNKSSSSNSASPSKSHKNIECFKPADEKEYLNFLVLILHKSNDLIGQFDKNIHILSRDICCIRIKYYLLSRHVYKNLQKGFECMLSAFKLLHSKNTKDLEESMNIISNYINICTENIEHLNLKSIGIDNGCIYELEGIFDQLKTYTDEEIVTTKAIKMFLESREEELGSNYSNIDSFINLFTNTELNIKEIFNGCVTNMDNYASTSTSTPTSYFYDNKIDNIENIEKIESYISIGYIIIDTIEKQIYKDHKKRDSDSIWIPSMATKMSNINEGYINQLCSLHFYKIDTLLAIELQPIPFSVQKVGIYLHNMSQKMYRSLERSLQKEKKELEKKTKRSIFMPSVKRFYIEKCLEEIKNQLKILEELQEFGFTSQESIVEIQKKTHNLRCSKLFFSKKNMIESIKGSMINLYIYKILCNHLDSIKKIEELKVYDEFVEDHRYVLLNDSTNYFY